MNKETIRTLTDRELEIEIRYNRGLDPRDNLTKEEWSRVYQLHQDLTDEKYRRKGSPEGYTPFERSETSYDEEYEIRLRHDLDSISA